MEAHNPQMAKLDPIVSEFETQEEADAYDKWFRGQVEGALASKAQPVSHAEVKARTRAILERHKHV